ncbi:MAG: M20/M25/M40 family metallo-hydrolase [Spirosomataceae bacterium]
MTRYFFFIFLLFTTASFAQNHLKIRAFRQQNEHVWLNEYIQLLSIPNVVKDTTNDIRKNALFISQMMERRGIKAELLELGGKTPPVVFGEVNVPGATQTVIFYAHYDGQPVQSNKWATGTAPFKPVVATNSIENNGKILPTPTANEPINGDWRIIARSTADDKAGVFIILSAYEALVKSGLTPSVNVKFFFEGEEEVGSDHLGEYLRKFQSRLASSLWVFCDGPVHQSGKKQVVFGCRGDINVELTVYGARRPLHSGHYGNWAPNPAMSLARLLASMKDASGKVTIEGFYDDVTPLSASELAAIKAVPNIDQTIRQELGFAEAESKGKTLTELINQPSLNINGFVSAGVGVQGANVVPATATALLDLRLVSGNDHQRQVQKVLSHVRKQGFYVIDHEPTPDERSKYPLIAKYSAKTGYNAQRTRLDLPIAQQVVKAIQSTVDYPVVIMPTLGGSLPLYLFEDILKTKAIITIPSANYDNNQHGENENIRIQNLWDGIETVGVIMTMK